MVAQERDQRRADAPTVWRPEEERRRVVVAGIHDETAAAAHEAAHLGDRRAPVVAAQDEHEERHFQLRNAPEPVAGGAGRSMPAAPPQRPTTTARPSATPNR